MIMMMMIYSGGAGAVGSVARPDGQDHRRSTQTARHKVCALHRRAVARSDHARRAARVHGPSCRHTQDGCPDCPQHVLTH